MSTLLRDDTSWRQLHVAPARISAVLTMLVVVYLGIRVLLVHVWPSLLDYSGQSGLARQSAFVESRPDKTTLVLKSTVLSIFQNETATLCIFAGARPTLRIYAVESPDTLNGCPPPDIGPWSIEARAHGAWRYDIYRPRR